QVSDSEHNVTDGEHLGSTAVSWLAVDGGQSAVRVRVRKAGQMTSHEATGPGVRHRPGGVIPGMLDSIRHAGSVLDHPRVDVAVLGMSGLPNDAQQLHQLGDGILAETDASQVLLAGDHVTAHAGALAGAPGVVTAVGTGVV